MKVVQGLRLASEQAALYAQGRTKPGKVVTNCDGFKLKSNHQAQPDGWGHAVDCAFIGPVPFSPDLPWNAYGELVRTLGLTWGGDFHSLVDKPHAELK